ncbi:heparin lyase I family protein [Mycobacterium manitobense]|uniref:Heparin lyase I family protein n=1 Tax=[Mycobacterium] manitobense TaxID=190147 RepID=A0A9X2YIT1_9MYCO|nr:polysaccharide lyase [[Mycobacterium] manitobense]MCV7168504.1 heparin lyase I family protein [[Mycobacterium] manitobense]
MNRRDLRSCAATSVVAAASLAVIATSAIATISEAPRSASHEAVRTAALPSSPPSIVTTLLGLQKLGVTSVRVRVPDPAADPRTVQQPALVIADGVTPTAARSAAATTSTASTARSATTTRAATTTRTATTTTTSTTTYMQQLSAYMQQLAAALAQPRIVPSGAKKLFTGDYNTGNFTQWAMLQAKGINAPAPANYCTYSACVRNGGLGHETAARFEVRDGDIPPFGGGERAEVTPGAWYAPSAGAFVKEGDERWYSFSMKFDEGFQNPRHGPDSWFMVSQWFPQQGGAPALTLQVTQDNYLELGGAGAAVPYRRKISPVKPGQWVDYVVHVKFSEDPNVGYAEVYENGKLVVEKHYRPTLVAGGGGAYYKQGVYRDVESTGTQVVWHDGLVIYEGVAPPTTLALSQSTAPVARTQTLVADAAVADTGIVAADTAVAQADEIDGQVPADRGTTASTETQETTSALDARSAAREERREAREERREAREERREARAAEREARAAERAARQEERAARIAERAARAADQTTDAESAEPSP